MVDGKSKKQGSKVWGEYMYGVYHKSNMSDAEQNRLIDKWVAEQNSHKGEIIIPQLGEYPVNLDNFYGSLMNELVTADLIRHYTDSLGDRNPLWRSPEYAQKTIWGGIIAPPTFVDSISQYGPWKMDTEQWSKFNWFQRSSPTIKYQLFHVIRPGDKFRLVRRDLGVEEVETKQPKPCRQFINHTLMYHINQRDETVAIVDYTTVIYINRPEGSPPLNKEFGRKSRRLADEEREAIYQGYAEETRQGADTLYWEKVTKVDEIKPLVVGPLSTYDAAANYAAITGHAVGFDMEWERIRLAPAWAWLDPETNTWKCGGEAHFRNGAGHTNIFSGGSAYASSTIIAGLVSRTICNWMGDAGFCKMIENNNAALTLLGDVIKIKGRVTKKYVDNGEHLIDLELRSENQDGLILITSNATVRLQTLTKL